MINIFISDLHLEESRPDITQLFLRFLEDNISADAFYILGDFFETWIGDDDLTPFNQTIINALRNATHKGLSTYLMHGNRDFLLGKKFLHMTGCKLLSDEYVVNLNGVPTLLLHGDTLCTQDINYLKFRKRSRNGLIQTFFLLRSLKKRREIAARYRTASKQYISTAHEKIMDVTQEEVERIMRKHQVQHMIHGHTHRQAIHQFQLNGLDATRTVLGPWHEHGSALICRNNGSQEFVIIK
ncbi:MAG: UDP-2,3-diacylglucosamine hydrolase [uncultured bacterium]|nr:MAG: UDP-2,3-diacylglucosamine hydrolase [uncultured bacterium]